MGMFDSLYFKCIFCGEQVEEQSKSGPSMLDVFHFEDSDLPLWLMDDMNGAEVECYHCNKKQKLIFDIEVKIKNKEIIPVDNLDYVEWLAKKKGL